MSVSTPVFALLGAGTKAQLSEETTTTNSDFFGTEVQGPRFFAVKHQISISMTVSGVLEVYMNSVAPAATNIKKILNSAVALVADAEYVFDIIVRPGQTYNLRHQAGVNSDVTCEIQQLDDIRIG